MRMPISVKVCKFVANYIYDSLSLVNPRSTYMLAKVSLVRNMQIQICVSLFTYLQVVTLHFYLHKRNCEFPKHFN